MCGPLPIRTASEPEVEMGKSPSRLRRIVGSRTEAALSSAHAEGFDWLSCEYAAAADQALVRIAGRWLPEGVGSPDAVALLARRDGEASRFEQLPGGPSEGDGSSWRAAFAVPLELVRDG